MTRKLHLELNSNSVTGIISQRRYCTEYDRGPPIQIVMIWRPTVIYSYDEMEIVMCGQVVSLKLHNSFYNNEVMSVVSKSYLT